MTHNMTENGYESPRSLDNRSSIFDNGTNTEGERRRNGFGSGDVTERGSQEQLGSQDDLEGQNQLDQQAETGIDPKKVGFRARVSCYTWSVAGFDANDTKTGRLMIEKDVVHDDNGDRRNC